MTGEEIAEIASTLTDAERDGLQGFVNSRNYRPAYEVWCSLRDRGLVGPGPRPDIIDPTPLGLAVWGLLFLPPEVREANARFARHYAGSAKRNG